MTSESSVVSAHANPRLLTTSSVARVLSEDPRERKFLFVITDGHPSGYDRIQEAFSKIVKKTEISGITLVGIGVTKAITSKFRNNARGTDLKELVIKFITAYR